MTEFSGGPLPPYALATLARVRELGAEPDRIVRVAGEEAFGLWFFGKKNLGALIETYADGTLLLAFSRDGRIAEIDAITAETIAEMREWVAA